MQTTSPHLQEGRTQRLGRPPLPAIDLRTEEMRLYLSLAERQRLEEDAETAAMRPAEYIRRLIMGHKPAAIENRKFGNPRLLLELNAIGNNLNQAVRDMHTGSQRKHDWEQLRSLLESVLERVAASHDC